MGGKDIIKGVPISYISVLYHFVKKMGPIWVRCMGSIHFNLLIDIDNHDGKDGSVCIFYFSLFMLILS